MSQKGDINRRAVLQGIGASGTLTLIPGLVSADGTSDHPGHGPSASVERHSGHTAKRLIGEMMRSESTKTVRRKLRDLGFTAKAGHAVAKRFEVASLGVQRDGVIVPLQGNNVDDSLWDGVSTVDSIASSVGYLAWEPGNATAQAFILGATREGLSATDLLERESSDRLRPQEDVVAMKLITPEETYTHGIDQQAAGASNKGV